VGLATRPPVDKLHLRSTHVNQGYEALPYLNPGDLQPALQEILGLYQPIGGPIRKAVTYFGPGGGLHVNVGHSEYFNLNHVWQRMTNLSSLDTKLEQTIFAGGKGFDLFGMFVSSLGEAVERCSGSLQCVMGAGEHVYGTHRELTAQGLRCLSPQEIPLFAPEQYRDKNFIFEPFTEETMLGWIEGERMMSGEKVWVPAQLLELMHLLRPGEGLIGYAVSGGLSCHLTREEALAHGVVELIERDSINLRWYCSMPAEEIVMDVAPEDPVLRELLDDLRHLPGDVKLYNHALDFSEVNVITAVQLDPWLKRHSYNAGGGADLDREGALLRALSEFGQSERTIQLAVMAPERITGEAVSRMFDMDPDEPISKINLFFKVIGYYGHRKNRGKLDWYLKGNQKIPFSSLPSTSGRTAAERFEIVTSMLRRHGIDPVVFDFSLPQLKALKVMKVFIPELTQAFVQSRPVFGHPRFKDAAGRRAPEDGVLSYADLRVDPLPYP
jgi:ribosomal protein S12 methylthiotransferase accessory factor